MEKWFVQNKRADFNEWGKALGVDPVIARIIRNRDILSIDEAQKFLGGSLNDLHSPWLLKDMDKAVNKLLEAIEDGKKIRVIGDYDVDGVTSSYILTKGIRLIGGDASTAIPHRIHDGYGLSENLVTDAAEDGIGLIITCDNGISAADAIEKADERGITVIVTDHHEVPFEIGDDGSKLQCLPKAAAVVDPKRDDCGYPFKGICGAMVVYKLMLALIEKTQNKALADNMDEFLQFAALGTVCDVMELKDENRIVVREGIKRIKNTDNPGLKALIQVNGLDADKISCHHLGFVLGPCINATGRLDSAAKALRLFETSEKAEAVLAATQLKEMNDSRKNMTEDGIKLAEKYIEDNGLKDKSVWLIFLPEVHESIAGIIAGKIREKYEHPVFVLTRGEDGVKGSGRSIEAYHMQEHMTQVAEYFTKFGGHAMAAGLSMREEDIPALDNAMNQKAGLAESDFVTKVHIDIAMPLGYGSMQLARQLEELAPFGTGNPQPLFAEKNLVLKGIRRFGTGGKYARLFVKDSSGRSYEVTGFENPEDILSFVEKKYGARERAAVESGNGSCPVSICYQLQINSYRGENSLQYMLKHYC